jgi:hypothetical protein
LTTPLKFFYGRFRALRLFPDLHWFLDKACGLIEGLFICLQLLLFIAMDGGFVT